jgi:hypothetical protein
MKFNLYLMKLRWVLLRRNFNKMPTLLKFLTAHALAMSAALFSVIPVFSFGIGNKPVSYAEWWSSGAGISASIIGIVLPISGYMLLDRNKHARIVYIGSIVFSCFLCPLLIFGLHDVFTMSNISVVASTICIFSVYLYLNKSVKSYFVSSSEVSHSDTVN